MQLPNEIATHAKNIVIYESLVSVASDAKDKLAFYHTQLLEVNEAELLEQIKIPTF